MRIYSDLHIHSRFSRATSERMNIEEIVHYSKIKGLDLVGTGDFTHPEWLKELKTSLIEISATGLYRPIGSNTTSVSFIIMGEVCTVFEYEGDVKKIHHVIMVPDIDIAEQVIEALTRFGSLESDGRPLLKMTAAELVEEVLGVSRQNVVFPAHVWTPWFSLFGAFSGFDRLEDCYQDQSSHIFALETGLSSDPKMNWRLSTLDRYTLISNSDAHSPWPWRIGREANVFELDKLTYSNIIDAIRMKDKDRFLFTIETNPAYGKYHWSGHRNCNVSMPPNEAIKLNNICPLCKRKLTEGVEERIEKLADRPRGFKPEDAIGFRHLLPLQEIIVSFLGVQSLSTKKVWDIYNALILRFKTEFNILLETPYNDLCEIVNPALARMIIRVRNDQVKVQPGYDGVYGKILRFEEENKDEEKNSYKNEKIGLERFI